MAGLFDQEPPAFVQASEETAVLLSIAKAEHIQYKRSTQDNVKRAKRIGDILIEVKRRCNKVGDWTAHLKTAEFSPQEAHRCMKVAENWDKLNHPSSVNQALKMLAEDVAEPEADPSPLPAQPATNLPLCKACSRLTRTGQSPKPHCQDCKALREQAAAQRQEAARNAPRAAPAPPATPAPVEQLPSEESVGDASEEPPAKDAPPPWADLSRLFGPLIRSLDVVGAAFEAKETPERYGIQRKIEEARQEYERWYKKLVKNKE